MICTCSTCLKKTQFAQTTHYQHFKARGSEMVIEYTCPSCKVKSIVRSPLHKISRVAKIVITAKKLKTDKYSWKTMIAIAAKICR